MPIEIDDLVHASQQATKVAWGDEPVATLGPSIEDLTAVINRAESARAEAITVFAAKAEHRAEGHSSPAPWLQHHCRLKKRSAYRIWRLSRALKHFPVAAEAQAAGEISWDHIEVLADAYKADLAEAWAEAEPLLVGYACRARFEDFARQVRKFADELDPKDAEDRFFDQLASRSLTKSLTLDGYGFVRMWMDPLSYQIYARELDRLIEELFKADWAAAKALLGRDPTPIEVLELIRSPQQRAHDAQVQMALRSRAARSGPGEYDGLVDIHVDTFCEAFRHLVAEDPDDQAEYPAHGFSETKDGAVISPVAAVYLAVLGQVRGIVFDEDGHIVSYGQSRRLFTPAQAAALRAKFRRCTHPYGCDRTGPLLQTDHLTEWRDHGPTDVANGEPKCGPHNRWKTNQRGHPPPPGRRDTDQRRAPPDPDEPDDPPP